MAVFALIPLLFIASIIPAYLSMDFTLSVSDQLAILKSYYDCTTFGGGPESLTDFTCKAKSPCYTTLTQTSQNVSHVMFNMKTSWCSIGDPDYGLSPFNYTTQKSDGTPWVAADFNPQNITSQFLSQRVCVQYVAACSVNTPVSPNALTVYTSAQVATLVTSLSNLVSSISMSDLCTPAIQAAISTETASYGAALSSLFTSSIQTACTNGIGNYATFNDLYTQVVCTKAVCSFN